MSGLESAASIVNALPLSSALLADKGYSLAGNSPHETRQIKNSFMPSMRIPATVIFSLLR
ncbi:hypothetical protein [Croceicoccus sp. YJ47]|uniref:hypothetical protein n=1 Tax=Croceicoccus sp. YJ47 TaxID=2798724 RepID=UPI001922D559|nr:hypothetical protein [Croceicoccus sp. YJ47]QQN74403.1 hypothetical protein JD971_00955 [Croceicoccus sp. YJ47]